MAAMAALDEVEMALWTEWKRASELVRARIVEEITAATGLSDPDFGVLTRVIEIGGGAMRQNQLAESMGYHRSRLSHHLSRMEERGLVTRRRVGNGVEVCATDSARRLAKEARPIHASAVRRHLLQRMTASERRAFQSILQKLTSG